MLSTPKLFDVHTHVQFAAFRDDVDAVIKRALDAGIWMINVGTQKDTSAKAVELAEKYPEGVYATVGLHPIHTEKSYHDPKELGNHEEAKGFTSRGEDFDYDFYKKLAEDPKVVAIGECGLDYYRIKNQESPHQNKFGAGQARIKQETAFRKQIELAAEVKKPLMIHCRNAFSDLIDVLVKCQMPAPHRPAVSGTDAGSNVKCSGIIHFFSGTKDDARKLLDLGFSFSFGGVITFSRDYDEVVKYIPLERIVLETDAPYVAPVPYRGKRNEPAYVTEVAQKLAELKNTSFEEVAEITTANTRRIFSL